MTPDLPQTPASHPNYVLIWGILVSALLVSLFLGYMDLPVVAMVLIFTIAIVKA